MHLPQALNHRRIARSLVTVFLLTFLQTVSAPLNVAQAAGTPAVSMPSNGWVVAASTTTTISGASVSGLTAGSYLVTISISGSVNGGVLKLPTTTGLTASYGYTTGSNVFSSFTTISFTGSGTDVNNALNGLQYIAGTAATTGTTPVIKISAVENVTGTAYNPANGHYYRAVKYSVDTVKPSDNAHSTAVTWSTTQSFAGQSGYLVTITSADENAFVANTISGAENIWIGAVDHSTTPSFDEGVWGWASTGSPEYGAKFWKSVAPVAIYETGTGGAPSNGYYNWCSGEPNNAGSGEDKAVTNWGTGNTCWNDLPNTYSTVQGFVIEWGTNASDGGFTNAAVATAKLYVAPTLTRVSGNNQLAYLSTALSAPLVTQLKDSIGTPIPGATITWSTASGTKSNETSTTNASGFAQLNSWTMPSSSGVVSLTGTYSGAGNPTATFSATASAVPVANYTIDNALKFNGSSQYASVATTTVIPTAPADPFTIEAWINPTSGGNQSSIVSQGTNSTRIYMKIVSGNLMWYRDGGGLGGEQTCGTISTNVWTHVALSWNGSNTYLCYINGALALTSSVTIGATTLNGTFAIGQYSASLGDATSYFPGSIDEVKIWKTVRDASSIATDMHTYTSPNTSGLIAYFPFNEGTGTNLFNVVRPETSVVDLSLTGAPVWDSSTILSTAPNGPYTVNTFKRTYITSSNGWIAPRTADVSYLLVAGGGGGGNGYDNGGGGGGGGGMARTGVYSISSGSIITVQVGHGGSGGENIRGDSSGGNGYNSIFGNLTSLGGGGGYASRIYPSGNISNARQGGTAQVGTTTAAQGGWGGSGGGGGGGGGGASGAGGNGSGSTYGGGGPGISNNLTGTPTAYSSGGLGGTGSTSVVGYHATANTGAGGGGGSNGASSSNPGGRGGSGILVFRYITALKPSYTKPTNAYLNLGMTESFTTNVAADSATSILTRTFTWESTTPAANGVYTLIKQGTGSANASFSWVPSDTTTSGSGYLYRLTVSDSDTDGLLISDSSTAYAIINKALVVSGSAAIPKAIDVTKNETFTITFGTSTYQPKLLPVIPGITLDTSTAGSAIVKISDTLTVGTYYETLTVTDSVSASVVTPLIIKVNSPPALTSSAEIVTSGQVFNLDFSNSASFNPATSAMRDISGTNRAIAANGTPSYSNDFSGIMSFKAAGNTDYLKYTNTTTLGMFTLETFVRIDAEPGAQKYIIASQYTGTSLNFNYSLVLDQARTLWGGWYSSGYIGYRTNKVLDLGKWYHVVVTYDSATTSIYIDGVKDTGGASTTTSAGTLAPFGGSEVYINRKWDADASTDISLGFVRIYNRALTQSEVTQNYNASNVRFTTVKQNRLKTSQKYGVLSIDSFTTTSGGDTKTITFAVGNRAGIKWDTISTPGQIKLSVQESLSAGTYYDTVTVTDNLGQSTYLPIKFTVTKADTLTISMSSSVTRVYNTQGTGAVPTPTITGLAGLDSATVGTRYVVSPGSTCATGGVCKIGDRGPGNGWVFYTSPTIIDSVTGISSGGLYLEIAPKDWWGISESTTVWSTSNSTVGGTSSAIGTGAANTLAIVNALGSGAPAANNASNLTYGGYSDWFLPSIGELEQAYLNLKDAGLGDLTGGNIWSSTEYPGSENTSASQYWFGPNPNAAGYSKTGALIYRPIRAFGGTPVKPIDSDTYTVHGVGLNFTTGALKNYVNVVFETSTLKITQATQDVLQVNLYGAVAGKPHLIQVFGGSGSGAITETVTAGSTATNCRITNHILANDNGERDQKACNIRVTKASSKNYLAASLDVTVYFMVLENNQPSGQVGGGTVIALNGANSVTVEDSSTVRAPRITSATLSGGTLTIYGEGFGNSTVSLVFQWMVPAATTPAPQTISGSQQMVSVAVPGGARSGPVLLIAPGGRDFTEWIDIP